MVQKVYKSTKKCRSYNPKYEWVFFWTQCIYGRCIELNHKTLKSARFYFGNDMFESKSNEVESRYLLEKVTSLQVESRSTSLLDNTDAEKQIFQKAD